MLSPHLASAHNLPLAQSAPLAAPLVPFAPGQPVRIGLLGLGTVGGGTYRVLRRNAATILARTGRRFEVTRVAVRNLARAQAQVDAAVHLGTDPFELVNHPDIDVVVETIGGTTVARQLVMQALANGKHVVTANKALLAEHGTELWAAAQAHGVVLAYEGAVAVSIPIIKALREGLSGNRIEWVAGIINGTSNYILSEMRDHGLPYATALAAAQRLGYAEADPTLDVNGTDAAHKLAILAANAFGTPVQFGCVHIEGIEQLDGLDVGWAGRLGHRVKLLGIARHQAAGLELRVHPTLVPSDHPLATVNGAMNGILVMSDAAGLTQYGGAGAGAEQTASAVIADLIDVARSATLCPSHRVPSLAFQPGHALPVPVLPIHALVTGFYLRLNVDAHRPQDQAVLAQHLQASGIAVAQHAVFDHPDNTRWQAWVVLTQPAPEGTVRDCVARLAALPVVHGAPTVLRCW